MENPLEGMNPKQRMMVGGVIALGIGLVVYTRWKAGQDMGGAAAAYPDQPQQASGGYGPGGGTTTVTAPNEGQASWYEQQLQEAEVAAAKLQNDYLGEQLRQQKSQFDLGQQHSADQWNIEKGVQQSYADLVNKQLGTVTDAYKNPKLKMECGKNESTYIDINGNLACKQSGKSGIKSAGDSLGQTALNLANQYLNQWGQSQMPGRTQQASRQSSSQQTQHPTQQRILGKPDLSSYGPPSANDASWDTNNSKVRPSSSAWDTNNSKVRTR